MSNYERGDAAEMAHDRKEEELAEWFRVLSEYFYNSQCFAPRGTGDCQCQYCKDVRALLKKYEDDRREPNA